MFVVYDVSGSSTYFSPKHRIKIIGLFSLHDFSCFIYLAIVKYQKGHWNGTKNICYPHMEWYKRVFGMVQKTYGTIMR